jgi:hypothetical protein
MKELIVIGLIVLVIYLNQSQCKTQRGGATAKTIGMGLAMTVIIAVVGYFAYKELSGTSPSPTNDSDSPGSTPVPQASPNEHGRQVCNTRDELNIGYTVNYCNPTIQDPPQLCPGNVACPANGVCTDGGVCLQKSIDICRTDPDCRTCMGSERIKRIGCEGLGLTDAVCLGSKPDPEPCPSGDEPADTYVEVKNVTGHPMWIWFNKDAGNISSHSFQPPLYKYASTTWGVQIQNRNSLYIYGNSDGWNGGQFVVTKYDRRSTGNGEINISGLTSFEFTINDSDIWGNISNVSGVNVAGIMDITGLSECDRGKTTNTNAEALLNCPPKFQCDPNVCVSGDACTLKKLTPSQIQATGVSSTGPRSGLNCGDNGDCLGCPLNERVTHECSPYPPWTTIPGDGKPGMFDSPCYGNILKKKHGCLEWWTNNSDDWKTYATQNGTDSYWWAMGEQVLGGNVYDESVTYPGGAIDAKTKGCISGTTSASDCAGYIVPNKNSSLMKCRINGQPFKVIYTIRGIMEHHKSS